MKIPKACLNRLMRPLVIALACQMVFLGVAVAQNNSQERRRPVASFDDVRTQHITLKITGKRPEMIRAGHRSFLVTESTEVFDSKGNVMELADMPVPCTAKIYYELGGLNNLIVWRIVYKGKLSGARTAWSALVPQ